MSDALPHHRSINWKLLIFLNRLFSTQIFIIYNKYFFYKYLYPLSFKSRHHRCKQLINSFYNFCRFFFSKQHNLNFNDKSLLSNNECTTLVLHVSAKIHIKVSSFNDQNSLSLSVVCLYRWKRTHNYHRNKVREPSELKCVLPSIDEAPL